MSTPITSGLITVSNGAEATAVAIAFDPAFYQRVAAIATETAIAVCREQDGGSTIAGHAARASRALQWFGQCSTPSQQIAMAMAVAADNTTNESSTSQTIANRLAAIWDTLSGN